MAPTWLAQCQRLLDIHYIRNKNFCYIEFSSAVILVHRSIGFYLYLTFTFWSLRPGRCLTGWYVHVGLKSSLELTVSLVWLDADFLNQAVMFSLACNSTVTSAEVDKIVQWLVMSSPLVLGSSSGGNDLFANGIKICQDKKHRNPQALTVLAVNCVAT